MLSISFQKIYDFPFHFILNHYFSFVCIVFGRKAVTYTEKNCVYILIRKYSERNIYFYLVKLGSRSSPRQLKEIKSEGQSI